mmetsp:Transcript_12551/g.25870  ORF Transcript_12551/g.25870 Transcript_12551/m.25870 type:complete len:251 (+) Transcript_12551:66-818(+)
MPITQASASACTLERTTSGQRCERQTRICLSWSGDMSLSGMHSFASSACLPWLRRPRDGALEPTGESALKRTSLSTRIGDSGSCERDSRWMPRILGELSPDDSCRASTSVASGTLEEMSLLDIVRARGMERLPLRGTSLLKSSESPALVDGSGRGSSCPTMAAAVPPSFVAPTVVCLCDAPVRDEPVDSDQFTPAPPASAPKSSPTTSTSFCASGVEVRSSSSSSWQLSIIPSRCGTASSSCRSVGPPSS